MNSSMIKPLLFSLALVLVIFLGWNNGISKAQALGSCGTGTECYSVPDGCGVGVGCVRTNCNDFDCPERDHETPEEYCFYCGSQPIEN